MKKPFLHVPTKAEWDAWRDSDPCTQFFLTVMHNRREEWKEKWADGFIPAERMREATAAAITLGFIEEMGFEQFVLSETEEANEQSNGGSEASGLAEAGAWDDADTYGPSA